MFNSYFFVFISSFVILFLMIGVAEKVGLMDKPNHRKLHSVPVPLVGGISIFFSITLGFLFFLPLNEKLILYLVCSAVLLFIGVIDDLKDISFKFRLLIQAGISLAMILIGDHTLHNLGYLMGSETIALSSLVGGGVTIIAVIGAINAFNMVDGIDGLLGGLSSVTFSALGIVFFTSGNHYLATLCFLIVTATIPYILLNLGIPFGCRFKVFMGDAGSMFIGFSVVWMLIRGTQDPSVIAFKPVTALWLIAIPLMDMATIMVRRVRKGQSPFKPDREHLHHICQRIGLSSRLTLVVICSMAILCATFGVIADLNGVSESIMFIAFLILFSVYFTTICYIFRITSWLKRRFNKASESESDIKVSPEF